MRANLAKPGQNLIYTNPIGEEMEAYFVKRHPNLSGRAATNVVRIPHHAGLDGPDDEGLVTVSDLEFTQQFRRTRR